MDTQQLPAFISSHSTLRPPNIPVSNQTNGSAGEIRDLWGEEVFETLVGIVMSMYARKGGPK